LSYKSGGEEKRVREERARRNAEELVVSSEARVGASQIHVVMMNGLV